LIRSDRQNSWVPHLWNCLGLTGYRRLAAIAGVFSLLAVLFAPMLGQAGELVTSEDWHDPAELARTWERAKVRVPLAARTLSGRLGDLDVPKGERFPTVIYMHGCNGFWWGSDTRLDFLADAGFAAIAPDSFARKKSPKSCDVVTSRGGLYRPKLIMRQLEAAYALDMARTLPWVDPDNIFLMGLSEGGITTATLETDIAINARVIEGWGCHAGWTEYRGLAAREPVLSLVAARDPWFRLQVLQGDCGTYMTDTLRNLGSRSVVYEDAPLSERHALLEDHGVQDTVRTFLKAHLK